MVETFLATQTESRRKCVSDDRLLTKNFYLRSMATMSKECSPHWRQGRIRVNRLAASCR